MAYGAPTCLLESYLETAAANLGIQASSRYLPGQMLLVFENPDASSSDTVKHVKEPTAIDLGKLDEVYKVHEGLMNDEYSLAEAVDEIREIRNRKKKFGTMTLLLIYGLAAVSVGPFGFSARPMDFPVLFLLGLTLGALQLGLAPHSTRFAHASEVLSALIISFAARGLGSIMTSAGQPMFCLSALAQSGVALILPGWTVLQAALEIQSRNFIAGSIRMVYASIYTLFLVLGMEIGTMMMGLVYPGATNDLTCHMPDYWNAGDHS